MVDTLGTCSRVLWKFTLSKETRINAAGQGTMFLVSKAHICIISRLPVFNIELDCAAELSLFSPSVHSYYSSPSSMLLPPLLLLSLPVPRLRAHLVGTEMFRA